MCVYIDNLFVCLLHLALIIKFVVPFSLFPLFDVLFKYLKSVICFSCSVCSISWNLPSIYILGSCRFLFDESCPDYKYYEYRLGEEEKALSQTTDSQTAQSGQSTFIFCSKPPNSRLLVMHDFHLFPFQLCFLLVRVCFTKFASLSLTLSSFPKMMYSSVVPSHWQEVQKLLPQV